MIRSVALVSAVDPYPVDAGKKVVLAGFVAYFADRLGADRVHYVLVGPPDRPAGPFPVALHRVDRPDRWAQLAAVATRIPTGRSSLQEALLRGSRTAAALRATLAAVAPDLVVFDTVRMGQYVSALPAPAAQRRICYLDDLFSDRYRAVLDAQERFGDVTVDPLGNFAENVPGPLRPLATWRPTQRALLAVESRLVSRSERRAAHRFDRCLVVSPNEARILARRAPGADVAAVPPMVSPPDRVQRRFAGRPEFVMLGLLSLAHNDDGLRWFLREVLPIVLRERPDAVLTVVGRHPGAAVVALARRLGDAVRLAGYVPVLDELLASTCAVVNPLRFGSGIKLKVVEALARGVPVVSTTVGADGIDAGAGSGLVLGDGPGEFAAALLALTAPQVNAEASAAAAAHFATIYARPAVFSAYDRAFGLAVPAL